MKKLITLMTLFLSMGVLADGAMAFSKDSLTWQKCTGCHEPKDGKISRVEEIRATPDEWGVIIDRMARLYDMDLNASERKVLLKEVCETQILSPEELDKVSYLNLYNNPQTVEIPQGEQEGQFFTACVRCHSAGKIKSYRMTESAWAKVREFHYYVVPTVDGQMREMKWYEESAAVLASLAKSLPYDKPWVTPQANPSGSWIVLGNEPGKGNYRGHASFKAGQSGSYNVEGVLSYDDGTSEQFQGEAVLYGGHALRTETRHNNFVTLGAYSFVDGIIKGEHHFPAPDFRTSTSTWYPADGSARILKVTPSYLLAGETTTLTLEGLKLPEIKAGDLEFTGGNVKVLEVRRDGETIVAKVAYQGKGAVQANLTVKNLNTIPVTLADRIDHIKITPELGRARVYGGIHFPAEGVQFEAVAYAAGDQILGAVPARFKLSEFVTREEDDDLAWLGAIAKNGTYIPTSDYGQIMTREYKTEGTGLVTVSAEYERAGHQYAAEAMLAVVPPDYVQRVK